MAKITQNTATLAVAIACAVTPFFAFADIGYGGGGGGGGNGPVVGSFGVVNGIGQVLGASTTTLPTLPSSCKPLLTTYMRIGRSNNSAEVKKLQIFLNAQLHLSIPVTGFFGPATEAAVKQFQAAHPDQVLTPWGLTAPTGYVFKTTQRWVNLLNCPSLNIPLSTR